MIADKNVVDRPIERAAVDNELRRVIEDVWSDLGQVLAVLVAALPHHIPEQHAALRGIDQVFDRGSKHAASLH